ncbi:DUF3800 domain-containing protein [Butyrivibrio sp. AE2032]|uniref:DUF3800 domain-containing protein n=1 Tax=Butyrivibrio sp. AE2032 TaxID=1458463 RepID=UPI000556C371|nr:DUF3800 domain-containing protein [Butyrivibrio sp. AE2032]
MKKLSIFVDESGDFGEFSNHSPYYIVTMVFHNQDKDISSDILRLNSEIRNLGYKHDFAIHTEPLIRKEEMYCNALPNERRAVFSKLFFFTIKADISYKSFVFEKKMYSDTLHLEAKIAKEISSFLRQNLEFFQGFDNVVLYYDNGQRQLTRILNTVLATELSEYEVRKVFPKDYKLFQAADLICTLELLDAKCQHGELSKSERVIFHSKRELYKQFIKPIRRKSFDFI